MKPLMLSILLLAQVAGKAQQPNYIDSLKKFQLDYVHTHEVVKKTDWKYFRFFPVNKKYRVLATFEKIDDPKGFIMKTSGDKTRRYFKYGTVSFMIDKKSLQLTVYQSEDLMRSSQYKNYLFIPFTDLTSGDKSYGGGKYLDFLMDDIKNNTLLIDFNKAYNPYCAYTTGYNCPIPPAENDLPIAINAGEMSFGKSH
ncbi:MAG: DUF1684 domain-containing protein [Ferruginibacter sp.]